MSHSECVVVVVVVVVGYSAGVTCHPFATWAAPSSGDALAKAFSDALCKLRLRLACLGMRFPRQRAPFAPVTPPPHIVIVVNI